MLKIQTKRWHGWTTRDFPRSGNFSNRSSLPHLPQIEQKLRYPLALIFYVTIFLFCGKIFPQPLARLVCYSPSFIFSRRGLQGQIQNSRGQVEYKARSILETLYSMRDIKLSPSKRRERRKAVPTSYLSQINEDVWRLSGQLKLLLLNLVSETPRGFWRCGWVVYLCCYIL